MDGAFIFLNEAVIVITIVVSLFIMPAWRFLKLERFNEEDNEDKDDKRKYSLKRKARGPLDKRKDLIEFSTRDDLEFEPDLNAMDNPEDVERVDDAGNAGNT